MKLRNPDSKSKNLAELSEKAFAMMILGDERAVTATCVVGQAVQFA